MTSQMDSHYFLGRSELLGWINDTLSLRLTKIEDTASGAVACQIMDALHPGVVHMKKVDFNGRSEYDFINNYKVLQDVFGKLSINKHVEVQKLTKAKPLDNIEFMQWFKAYFDGVTGGNSITDYDGPGRRSVSKTGDIKGAGRGPAIRTAPAATAGAAVRKPLVGSVAPSGYKEGPIKSIPGMSSEVEEWRLKAETFEKEKEFYYSKLRDIELLCSTPSIQTIPIIKHVEAVLYAPTIEEGEQALEAAQLEYENGA